jgi:serine/threonine-protein kinase RsbW
MCTDCTDSPALKCRPETHDMFVLHEADEMTPFLNRVVAILRRFRYSPREIHGIRLALEEAIVNSIRHGNSCDPSKCVWITYQLRVDELIFNVRDEGTGFDLARVPNPTLPANLDLPSGRGLLLMRRYMTTVQHSEGGACVTMCKVRQA